MCTRVSNMGEMTHIYSCNTEKLTYVSTQCTKIEAHKFVHYRKYDVHKRSAVNIS